MARFSPSLPSLSMLTTGTDFAYSYSFVQAAVLILHVDGMALLKMSNVFVKGTLALLIYFCLNLALTILNKLLLQRIKFPYLLTALHAGSSWLGCAVLLRNNNKGKVRIQTLQLTDHVKLVLFSILYSVNIGISNVSLHLVPLALHQLLRATTPAMTAALLRLLDQKHYTLSAYASLSLVVCGVAIATTPRGRDQLSSVYPVRLFGIALTLLGAFLASLKSVAASAFQNHSAPTGKRSREEIGMCLSALELVRYICPLALLQSVLYAWLAGEWTRIPSISDILSPLNGPKNGPGMFSISDGIVLVLLMNCLVAFGLNIASFEANRRVGALGITIAGNVKQVFIVVLGVIIFGEAWTWVRWAGVLSTMIGSCWFVFEESRKKKMVREPQTEEKQKDRPRALEEGLAKEEKAESLLYPLILPL